MKILFISLGCDKNLVDTEKMLGILVQRGFSITDDEQEADAVVVNTCCFINDAKQESINTLLEMAQLRENGSIKALIAAGCLAQRYQEEIQREIPEVDAILGTTAIDVIADTLDEVFCGKGQNHLEDINRSLTNADFSSKRIVTTGGHYAYLKIAEGCDKHCSYCIIPKVRGHYRSVPMEELVQEAKQLVASGVKELILVAQETTLYGVDLYGEKRLPELLRRLCAITGIYWIRILYCYPEEITDELIETIKSEPKICNYLDIPIQHASNTILKRMGRRTDQNGLVRIIAKLRDQIPDICLRTTLITGFPGETAEDHVSLIQFVDEMEFDRLGVFCYSQEEDTPAALFENQIDEEVKLERQEELMELQQEIAFEKAQNAIGSTLLVMVEGSIPDEHVYVARSYKDAPNVDGYVFIRTGKELMTGDFVRVQITNAHRYDLIGEIKDEFTE
ncbi:MAG: 30S ribosomal protein S12 methylthiotransferase RimO [Lachnospiraceae bacterium]|nr:30S ribosomal protein S12 methylthiotransferase RimO [Lachnospiraceae bacterium]HBV83258.1 30S ribosomal protein S12 methylthiotransferase RimO [Lachnospiraceae bacterium]